MTVPALATATKVLELELELELASLLDPALQLVRRFLTAQVSDISLARLAQVPVSLTDRDSLDRLVRTLQD